MRGRFSSVFAGLLASLVIFLAASGIPLAAQNTPAPVWTIKLSRRRCAGRFANVGCCAHGSKLSRSGRDMRVTQTSTGKAWITWTDEEAASLNFPRFPPGTTAWKFLNWVSRPPRKKSI